MSQKRAAESDTDKEMRKEQSKECMRQKRAAESETDKEMRKEQDKECKRQKREERIAARFCLLHSLSCSFLISLSVSLSAARFCLLHSLSCSFLCSAVLGVLCKNGNFFWMPSIKSLGNFLILLLKDFNILFSSSVLNFGVLSSISFFYKEPYRFLSHLHSIKLQECYGFLLDSQPFLYDNNRTKQISLTFILTVGTLVTVLHFSQYKI